MFNKLLQGLKGKTPPPEVQITAFDFGAISFTCAKTLAMGSTEVLALLPDGTQRPARLMVETYLSDQGFYWASLEEPADLEQRLLELFPPTPEEEEAAVEPVWEEKRAVERLATVLGLMSPVVAGFKALTHDLTPVGLRMVCDSELPVDKVIKLRLELDDARIPPMELTGRVVWCRPREPKGFWGGISFVQISDHQREVLEKFINAARSVEHGVFSRDYAAD